MNEFFQEPSKPNLNQAAEMAFSNAQFRTIHDLLVDRKLGEADRLLKQLPQAAQSTADAYYLRGVLYYFNGKLLWIV